MSKINSILLSISGLLAIISGLLLVQSKVPGPALGSTQSGLANVLATSSTIGVGTTSVVTLFTPTVNSSCTSRVISTVGQPIMLSFGSTTPTATEGHIQTASTTVVYDSGLYGCGYIRAYGYQPNTATPSTTISIMEFSQ